MQELDMTSTFISSVAGAVDNRGANGKAAASAIGVLENRMASANVAAVRALSILLPSSGIRPAPWVEVLSEAAAADKMTLANGLEGLCFLLPAAAPCSI